MKKALALILILIFGAFVLVGCSSGGGGGNENEPAQTQTETDTDTPESTSAPEPELTGIVPAELTFGDYDLDFSLPSRNDDGSYNYQQMSEDRLDAAVLLNFYDQIEDLFDDIYAMTYEEIAPWVGCEASYMTASPSNNSVTYVWQAADKENGQMTLQFREKDGAWLFYSWGNANLR